MNAITWRKVWVHSRIGEPIRETGHTRAPLVARGFNRDVASKLAASYTDMAQYWMGRRVVTSWQTVEFIAATAGRCAALAAHYARLAQ